MHSLSIPIPDEISRHAKEELEGLPAVLDPETVVNTAVPLLEVFATTYPPHESNATAVRVTEAALATLDALPTASSDISWLGARYQLEEVRKALGLTPSTLSAERCAALLSAGGVVTMPGVASGDTQGTFYARELGCGNTAAQLQRPYTRAGWLLGSAVDPYDTLSATSAGLRLATLIGTETDFASKIRPSVARSWSSLPDDKSLSADAGTIVLARLAYAAAATKTDKLELVSTRLAGAVIESGPSFTNLLAAGSSDENAKTRAAKAVLAGPDRALGGRVSIDMAAGLFLCGWLSRRSGSVSQSDGDCHETSYL